MSPKGVPHIFEYAVGPGVFTKGPAKPEKGKVALLTLRTELFGLLNPVWAKYGLSWTLLLCFLLRECFSLPL